MHAIELDATLKLAKTKLRSGKVPEAEAMYRKVLEGDPKCAEAIHFLGLAAMQRAEKNIGDIVEELTRSYHRIRQESIDEELFDVIAGYEGMRPTS